MLLDRCDSEVDISLLYGDRSSRKLFFKLKTLYRPQEEITTPENLANGGLCLWLEFFLTLLMRCPIEESGSLAFKHF